MNNPFRSNPIILKNSDLIWVRFYFDLRRRQVQTTLKEITLNTGRYNFRWGVKRILFIGLPLAEIVEPPVQ